VSPNVDAKITKEYGDIVRVDVFSDDFPNVDSALSIDGIELKPRAVSSGMLARFRVAGRIARGN